MTDVEDRYLTPEEVAPRLGVHRETVYRWLTTGKLPGRKIGGRWFVSERRLAEEVEARGGAAAKGAQ